MDCRPAGIYVDCTLGEGGHAVEVLRRSHPSGRLIGIDCDGDAIEIAKKRLSVFRERVTIVHDSYVNLNAVLESLKIKEVDGILIDLGSSSYQLNSKERGFSFQVESPLDMRFDQRSGISAFELINKFPVHRIEDIIRQFGEERYAGRIARVISEKRGENPIFTTAELAGIIKYAVPRSYRFGRIHPATRSFQAIRIAVNDELGNLKVVLNEGINCLKKGGKLCVIAFHSLEDRIIKQFFKGLEKGLIPSVSDSFRILTKKPVIPQISEVNMNPRSRSSKLRVVLRI